MYRLILVLSVLLTPCAALGDTISDIKETGVLKIGYRVDIPPFSQVGDDGTPEGFSIDLCKSIANFIRFHLGIADLKTEYVEVTSANRLSAVADGQVHIECGNTTRTLSRQELVDFSNLFYVTGASFMTTKDLQVNGIRDIAGLKVGVVENTTTLQVLKEQMAQAKVDAKLDVVADHMQALKLLESGRVDMIAADRATLLGLGFVSKQLQVLRLTPVMLSFEPYAFPLPRNDADFRLLINRALSDIYLSGQVGEIWQEWFGRYEVKPTQLLLNVYRLNSLSE